jgi:ActR/RegA family two-component response regulator
LVIDIEPPGCGAKKTGIGGCVVTKKRLLIVDDNEEFLEIFQQGLVKRGFDVTVTRSVNEALRIISVANFDVLLCDLHLPDAGDGLTVVSAMRHANPNSVTLVLTGYPALQEATNSILRHANEVLLKPIGLNEVVEIIEKKLLNPSIRFQSAKQRVAVILERERDVTILNWLSKVERDPELNVIALSPKDRTGHLPLILGDLVLRLCARPHLKALVSRSARDHGVLRREQGYTLGMVVEESRILQVCLFNTLQNNLGYVDFDNVLLDVMTIADEVDSQLKQAVLGFMNAAEPVLESLPA